MFQVWEMSRYAVLPFPGAWVDQPTWIRADFLMLLSVSRWYKYNENLPNTDGFKNVEDVA
jgi:hypothetical protein